ncbi:MAG: hypothetical protein AB7G15_16790 [Alphaproteobacteria bacterium]
MFIWRTLDKSAMAGLLRLMAESDPRVKARTARGAASGQAPKANAEIVPPRATAKPR